MALTRIRLRFPGEQVEEHEKNFKLNSYDVEAMRLKLQTDKTVADNNIRKSFGQLMYLNNLSRMRQSKDPGIETESCPVCTEVIGPHMVLLFCGHSLCVECTLAMMKRYHNTIKCPTCRTRANVNEISYVIDNLINEKTVVKDVEIKGVKRAGN